MDLSDALGSGGNNQSVGAWPGGNTNQSGGGWPGGNTNQSGGGWPGAGTNQSGGGWPGAGTNQSGGGGYWPGQQPPWPNQPGQPAQSGGWPHHSGPAVPVPSAPGGTSAVQHFSTSMPFSQSLRDGCYNNMLITIHGMVKPNANKFTVDLSAGNDIPFHFNPRFNEGGKKLIVRNSLISNKWGTEERELQHFPFNQGQSFEMKILCKDQEFRVAVNGSHLLAFRHRYRDLRSIKGLGIFNDVTLSEVKVETVP